MSSVMLGPLLAAFSFWVIEPVPVTVELSV
jgi:hypothetical protein